MLNKFLSIYYKVRRYYKNRKDILFTAIITSLFAALFAALSSYFLTSHQLKKEQDYWENRFARERLLAIQDKQMNIYEDVNSKILEAMVLAKEIKIYTPAYRSYLSALKSGVVISKDTFDPNEFHQKLATYHKHLFELSSKLDMTGLYFNRETVLYTDTVRMFLTKNFQNDLYLTDENIPSDLNVETIPELDSCRFKLIQYMMSDMRDINKSLFKEDAN